MAKKITEQEIKKIIQKEVEKAKNEMNERIISQFKEECIKLISKSVDAFYDDYTPSVYKRTDAFQAGAKKGYNFSQNRNELDIELISDYVPDHPGWNKKNPQPYSGEQIWQDAFVEGIHGMRSVKVMEKSPYKLIEEEEQKLMDKISESVINDYINSL